MFKPLLFGALISFAFANLPYVQAQDMPMMMMKQGKEMSQADKDYMAAMQKMNSNMMKMEITGDPDGDFVRMMIPHHQSAVDMAEALLKQDDIDPMIKAMAEKVRDSQTKEIAEMKAWLEAHPE
jgi:uncharacterized protein (DUF305 family)